MRIIHRNINVELPVVQFEKLLDQRTTSTYLTGLEQICRAYLASHASQLRWACAFGEGVVLSTFLKTESSTLGK